MALFISDEEYSRISHDPSIISQKVDAYISQRYNQIETGKAQLEASLITAEQTIGNDREMERLSLEASKLPKIKSQLLKLLLNKDLSINKKNLELLKMNLELLKKYLELQKNRLERSKKTLIVYELSKEKFELSKEKFEKHKQVALEAVSDKVENIKDTPESEPHSGDTFHDLVEENVSRPTETTEVTEEDPPCL